MPVYIREFNWLEPHLSHVVKWSLKYGGIMEFEQLSVDLASYVETIS